MRLASATGVTPLQPIPPAWVAAVASTDGFSRISTHILSATSLEAATLADAVGAAYASLATALRNEHRHALRIWNFVPGIQAPLGAGDRYMAFNVGRFAAYAAWYGGADTFSVTLPTASAVGIAGDTLWIHVLAAGAPGVPIENPRQVPSYRYSDRYGPRPPCFARAMRVGSTLMIGGTASILGEDSRHMGNLEAQTRETLANIGALIERAGGGADGAPLASLRDLRIHVLHACDAPAVRAIVKELAPHLADIEMVQADLCRKELLVEIEGRADL